MGGILDATGSLSQVRFPPAAGRPLSVMPVAAAAMDWSLIAGRVGCKMGKS